MTAPAATDPLPDDPPARRVMVREPADALADARREIDARRARLDQLLRRLDGAKPERAAASDTAVSPPPPAAPDPAGSGQPPRRGHGRRRLPADLPRQRVEHDPTDAEKGCPCRGGGRVRIGEEVSERLDYRPASPVVVEHVRPKYACPTCRGHVAVLPPPSEPLPKAVAATGLLAQLITAKFADHLPLYRRARILGRHGADLPRSTPGDWPAGCAEVLRPIDAAMCGAVRRSKVVHTDDTPVRVRDRDRDRTRTGRIWVYVGDPAHPYTVYDATPSRARDGPQAFLTGFTGFVPADAFGGYDGLSATGATEVACRAHARRKFVDARDTDPARCECALAALRRLYAMERQARELTSDMRRSLRQRESGPVLQELGEWLETTRRQALPKSPLAQAVTYALNQWAALNRYTADGDRAIDNTAAERALRGVAVGRKNWLFWGSDAGGRTAAVLHPLTATCGRHGIDPWAYLADVLTRLPSHPADRVAELLPDTWAAAGRSSS